MVVERGTAGGVILRGGIFVRVVAGVTGAREIAILFLVGVDSTAFTVLLRRASDFICALVLFTKRWFPESNEIAGPFESEVPRTPELPETIVRETRVGGVDTGRVLFSVSRGAFFTTFHFSSGDVDTTERKVPPCTGITPRAMLMGVLPRESKG